MKGWRTCPLEEVVRFIDYRGRTPKKTESGMRLITAKNVKMGYLQIEPREFVDPDIYSEWMTRGIPKKEDVLFTTEAPLGNVAQLDTAEKVVFAQRIIVMQPDREVLDPTFLKYLLLSGLMQKRIHEKGTGATVKGIKSQLLKKIPIPFPASLADQKRIVAILDEAFEGIDGAIANTEKNLANARELFESCLSSLDAEKRSLGDLVNIRTGKLNANAATEGGQYPFFTCSRDIYQIDHYAFDCEAILLAGNNAVGDFNVKHYRGKFNAYQRTYVITVNQNSEILYRYLYFQLLKSLKEFKSKSVGAGTRFLKLDMIKDLQISLPSLDEQEKIIAVLDELREAVQELEAIYQRKLAALNELKQSILQKAFSGELTAEAGDRAVEGAKEVVAA